MKRIFDLILVLVAIIFLTLPIIFMALAIKLSSPGPVLYWSFRVGRKNKLFKMPKFRTMSVNAPEMATNLLPNPNQWMTPIGSLLRKSSLDELPQLWCILLGDMSFVGPRPALFNQYDLILLRVEKGVDELMPGLTGWAQINGRDELSLSSKVGFDMEYMKHQSLIFDCKILWLTIFSVLRSKNISH